MSKMTWCKKDCRWPWMRTEVGWHRTCKDTTQTIEDDFKENIYCCCCGAKRPQPEER